MMIYCLLIDLGEVIFREEFVGVRWLRDSGDDMLIIDVILKILVEILFVKELSLTYFSCLILFKEVLRSLHKSIMN